MPASDTVPPGAPCWDDLVSSDPDRAAAFYGAVLGWTAEGSGPEYGGYVSFRSGGRLVAGMVPHDGSAGQPDAWTTYLSVPDVAEAASAATAAGGQVHVPPTEVGTQGWMALVADPAGATVGLWQPGEHVGHQLDSEAGAPCWHELHTSAYVRTLDFYRTAFGWQTAVMSDEDDFRYTNLVVDGTEYAGVMDAAGFLPDGAPSTWRVYFGTEDVDAAVARAVELGGTVEAAPQDSPFGRLAGLADPTGASFKLVSAPRS